MDGISIFDYEVKNPILNVMVDRKYIISGCVPRFEEHSVRRKAGYTFDEWYNLPPSVRALEVALSRTEMQLERLQQEAEERLLNSRRRNNQN